MWEILNVYIFSTKNEVMKKRWSEMYGTKVISIFMLHKVSQKVFSKMPNAYSMIEWSHLCILLYNSLRIKYCWPYLWGVIIQRNKGYFCFQIGMEKILFDLCQVEVCKTKLIIKVYKMSSLLKVEKNWWEHLRSFLNVL